MRSRDGRAPSGRALRLGVLVVVALTFALSTGCGAMRFGARGARAFFSSPRAVETTTDPVRSDARLAVLWVGQSTALVQMDDKVVLTDPVFTSTAGQVWKRSVAPGLDPKDVPPIDVTLISHMHVDHLSLGSLELLEDRIRALLLPSGGTTYLTDFGFPAYELRTWQTWERDGLRVTAVPITHVGWRYGVDEAWMKHAYTAYVVEYRGLKVYFAGDGAYDQRHFVETAQRIPGIDLALLPIAPIEPRDAMRERHMDPSEAVQAFIDLGAARMVPIHYDTFVAGDDEPGDALRALTRATSARDLGARVVAPLAIGERRVFIEATSAQP